MRSQEPQSLIDSHGQTPQELLPPGPASHLTNLMPPEKTYPEIPQLEDSPLAVQVVEGRPAARF